MHFTCLLDSPLQSVCAPPNTNRSANAMYQFNDIPSGCLQSKFKFVASFQ